MPYEITKVSRGQYEVSNPETGKVHAKHTSLKKAKAQVRLLYSLEKPKMKGGRARQRIPTRAQLIGLYRDVSELYNQGRLNEANEIFDDFVDGFGIDDDLLDRWDNDDTREMYHIILHLVSNAFDLLQAGYEMPADFNQIDEEVIDAILDDAEGSSISDEMIDEDDFPELDYDEPPPPNNGGEMADWYYGAGYAHPINQNRELAMAFGGSYDLSLGNVLKHVGKAVIQSLKMKKPREQMRPEHHRIKSFDELKRGGNLQPVNFSPELKGSWV
jgi:hypothetical protein